MFVSSLVSSSLRRDSVDSSIRTSSLCRDSVDSSLRASLRRDSVAMIATRASIHLLGRALSPVFLLMGFVGLSRTVISILSFPLPARTAQAPTHLHLRVNRSPSPPLFPPNPVDVCLISVEYLAGPSYFDSVSTAASLSRPYENTTNPRSTTISFMGLAQLDIVVDSSAFSLPRPILSNLELPKSRALLHPVPQGMNRDLTSVSSDQVSRPSVIILSIFRSMARGFPPIRRLLLFTGANAICLTRSMPNTAFLKLLAMLSLWMRQFALSSFSKERTVPPQCLTLCGRIFPCEIPGTHSKSFVAMLACVFFGSEATMGSVLMTILGSKGWSSTSRYKVTRFLCSGFTVMLHLTHSSQGWNPLSCSSENLSNLTSMYFRLYCLYLRGCLIPSLCCCMWVF